MARCAMLLVSFYLVVAAFGQPKPYDVQGASENKPVTVDLTPDLSPGSEFDFSWSLESKEQWYPDDAKNPDMAMYWGANRSYHFCVVDRDAKGTATIKASFTRFDLKFKDQDTSISFDSLKNNQEDSGHSFYAFCAIPLGKSFTFQLTSQGAIENIKGLDKIRNAIIDSDPDPLWEGVWRDIYSDSGVLHDLNSYFNLFAFHDVGVGDSWNRTWESDENFEDNEFEVMQIDADKGRVVIAIKGTRQLAPRSYGDEIAQNTKTPRECRISGTATIDLASKTLLRGIRLIDKTWDLKQVLEKTTYNVRIEECGRLALSGKPAPNLSKEKDAKRIKQDSGTKYDITPKFEVGDELRFRVGVSKDYMWTFPGDASKKEREIEVMEWLIRVEDRLATGNLHMSLTFLDVDYAFQNEEKHDRFDSRAFSYEDSESILGQFWLAWIGKSVDFELSPTGEVLNFRGMEAMRSPVLNEITDRMLKDRLVRKLNTAPTEHTLKGLFSSFSYKPVSLGEKWVTTIKSTAKAGAVKSQRNVTQHQLDAITSMKGMTVAEVASQSSFFLEIGEECDVRPSGSEASAITYFELGTGKIVLSKMQSQVTYEYGASSSTPVKLKMKFNTILIQDPQE